jgi:hypothetical protein
VHAGRNDDETAVGLQVDPAADDGRRQRMPRIREIEMDTAAAGSHFGGRGERAVAVFQRAHLVVPAVAGVDVEHDHAGDGPGDDAEVAVRPAVEPCVDVHLPRRAPLVGLPSDSGVLSRRGAVAAAAGASC